MNFHNQKEVLESIGNFNQLLWIVLSASNRLGRPFSKQDVGIAFTSSASDISTAFNTTASKNNCFAHFAIRGSVNTCILTRLIRINSCRMTRCLTAPNKTHGATSCVPFPLHV